MSFTAARDADPRLMEGLSTAGVAAIHFDADPRYVELREAKAVAKKEMEVCLSALRSQARRDYDPMLDEQDERMTAYLEADRAYQQAALALKAYGNGQDAACAHVEGES